MGVSLPLGQSGQKLFLAADKRRAHWAVTAVVEGKGAVKLFFFFFLQVSSSFCEVKEQKKKALVETLCGSSSHVVVCVRQRGGFFLAVEESVVRPPQGFIPVSLFVHLLLFKVG